MTAWRCGPSSSTKLTPAAAAATATAANRAAILVLMYQRIDRTFCMQKALPGRSNQFAGSASSGPPPDTKILVPSSCTSSPAARSAAAMPTRSSPISSSLASQRRQVTLTPALPPVALTCRRCCAPAGCPRCSGSPPAQGRQLPGRAGARSYSNHGVCLRCCASTEGWYGRAPGMTTGPSKGRLPRTWCQRPRSRRGRPRPSSRAR